GVGDRIAGGRERAETGAVGVVGYATDLYGLGRGSRRGRGRRRGARRAAAAGCQADGQRQGQGRDARAQDGCVHCLTSVLFMSANTLAPQLFWAPWSIQTWIVVMSAFDSGGSPLGMRPSPVTSWPLRR